FERLGSHHVDITTRSEPAQKYFDQGIRLVYAFNHEEAVRSFEEAARLDPDPPMPYWGAALALGPNINAPIDRRQESRASDFIQKARARLQHVTPRERAYVEALAKRYVPNKKKARRALDESYVKAMREISRQFPDDLDAATLFAEALMDLRPWDYWKADGRPQPGTEEIITTLESVLRRGPDHPGACHYYIHAVEASLEPQRALACAKRLADLMPGAGHLVHMPAHVYMRLGLYHDASERNERAATVDHAYLDHRPTQGMYASKYYAHNLHFLSASLTMEGRSADAVHAARKLVSTVPRSLMALDSALELYAPTPVLTLARFGRWSDIIREPPPAKELRLTTGMWHFARGLAFAATTRFGSAEGELFNLKRVQKGFAKGNSAEVKIRRTLMKVTERVLTGEIAARRGRYDEGIRALKDALRLEAELPYTEPPLWYQPVRHNLGAVFLSAGRAAEAEQVYREDLRQNPHNGWALYGLVRSLRDQRKEDEAVQEEERLQKAWSRADVTLVASRF
ncbi:MAG: hypothetical protein ACREIM_05960, partial [Nitrospiraceae bacterium]